jgi:2,4-diketo-3-deoxy-L-fuconate hydrolase
MKLIRHGAFGNEKPGIITEKDIQLDVSAFGEDYNESFFESDGINRLSKWLKTDQDSCPIVEAGTRLGSCVARPSKIVCIGLNYAKHAAESGMDQTITS